MPKAAANLTPVLPVSLFHNLSLGELVDQLGHAKATRWTLDADRVKAEMGEAWCNARSKVSAITTVRVSARTGIKKAA